jgi:protein OS-9
VYFVCVVAAAALCLYRQEGLWTYEMCYKKGTRQFRQVQAVRQVTLCWLTCSSLVLASPLLSQTLAQDGAGNRHEDFSCGKYTGDEAQSEEIKYDASSASIPLKYVSHNMSGGAECVMTGQGRTTEVSLGGLHRPPFRTASISWVLRICS